jgi:DNA recombination protein RmuC
MSSSTAFALIALALVAGAGALALLVRARESGRFDRLLAEAARAREASESVDRRFDEFRRSVEERVRGVEQSLSDGQKGLAQHLGESGRLMKDVGEQVGRVFKASQKIEELAGNVTRLEDLLKPPKLRGALGETFLEQALAQVLPASRWKMQYRFPDGVTVDAAIFVGERCVSVDSKFPLDNYRRAHESADESERRKASRDFEADVRRHVDTIRAKYIRPECGTYDFALMYVPAEAVYCDVAGDGEEGALADYAIGQRVVPVSPRLLYAYLATVAMGLRGLELQERAHEVQEKLADLARLWERVETPFETVGTHLTNAQKKYEEATKAVGRFGARLEGIAEGAAERLETEMPDLPSLLPPT